MKTPMQKDAAVVEHEGFSGARKLVRPQMPPGDKRRGLSYDYPLSKAVLNSPMVPESSHAEVFYLQKQMQQQTEMTVVLDDGEVLRGTVQWYDKHVIKMRVGRERVLVFKSAVKYMHKSGEER